MSDDLNKMYHVGSLVVGCPRCGEELTIPIMAGVVSKEGEPNKIFVRTGSDVMDYQLHTLMHKEGAI